MNDETNHWAEAEAHLSAADPSLRALIERHAPCRLRPDENLFVGLLDAIVSQQLSVKASATIFARFAALYDGSPLPEAVAETPDEPLRACGLSRAKAAYVRDLADHVRDGRLELERMDALSDDDVIAELTAVKGIGRWTAEMILIFHLNRPDVLPVDDLGIREGFKRTYGLPERPGPEEMQAIAEPWRPWRSVGSWYLWRALDNEPMKQEAKP
ncbi:MAG TPA: DNA-3-methyladenine glycosylase [Armatimonadota bacterium]|jgi:DNA-3-methyladenine glycosylase II